ncbi:internalin [Oligoflexus tunisiensis]|uniref:internalin n=1 Tax=Oligoflexus tunisiensis TaxID=708132 RepID=UPI00114CA39C|nr:internalin [Oligoflexus tunisiensis]
MKQSLGLWSSLLVLASTTLLTNCRDRARDTDATLMSEVPSTHSDTGVPGQAYHSDKRKLLNVSCIEGEVTEQLGNVTAEFELKQDLGFNDLIDRLGGKLSVDTNFPTIRAGASARYATENTASVNANSYNFFWRATPKKRVLKRNTDGTYRLSAFGQEVAKTPAFALDRCGDEFITSIEYGAMLNVTLKMEFRNEQDKRDIGGNLTVDVTAGVVRVDGKLDYLDQTVKKSVKITVEAQQHGGDPLQLLQIIPDNLVTCSLDNPSLCFSVFAEAIKYAKNDLAGQFTSLDSYNVVKYTTEKYTESGIYNLQPPGGYPTIGVLVEDARQTLDRRFQQALMDRSRARKLINSYREWLSEELYEQIMDLEAKANRNTTRLSNASVYCYDNPYNGCLEQAENTLKLLETYDPKLLSIQTIPLVAYHRCELARKAAVAAQVVSESWSLGYRRKGYAPVFFDNSKPELGVEVWGPCEEALAYYGDYFKV